MFRRKTGTFQFYFVYCQGTTVYSRKMNLTVAVLLLTVGAVFIDAQHVTSWGNVQSSKLLAEQKIEVAGGWFQVRERFVSYQSVSGIPEWAACGMS